MGRESGDHKLHRTPPEFQFASETGKVFRNKCEERSVRGGLCVLCVAGGAPGGFMAGRAEPDRVQRHRFSLSTWQERRALIGCRFGGSGESHLLFGGFRSRLKPFGVPIKVSKLFNTIIQRTLAEGRCRSVSMVIHFFGSWGRAR